MILHEYQIRDYIKPAQLGCCAYIKKPTIDYHSHNYYEFFLITQGGCVHTVNGTTFSLSRGTMSLIRPQDHHCFGSSSCEMFNLVLSVESMEKVKAYITQSNVLNHLLTAETPVHIHLLDDQVGDMQRLLEDFMLTPHRELTEYNAHFQTVVIAALQKFFATPQNNSEGIPDWINQLLSNMYKQENYARGLQAMYELSGYSKEYLCRSMKRYLHKTPTEVLNQIRIQAASRELIYTSSPIIEIAANTGYETLSHFYHLFKQIYHMSPSKYRRMHQLLPARAGHTEADQPKTALQPND